MGYLAIAATLVVCNSPLAPSPPPTPTTGRKTAVVASIDPNQLEVDGNVSDWDPGLHSITPVNTFHQVRFLTAYTAEDLFIAAMLQDAPEAKTRAAHVLWHHPQGNLVELTVSRSGNVQITSQRLMGHQAQSPQLLANIQTATAHHTGGWAAEIRIPLHALIPADAPKHPPPPVPFNIAYQTATQPLPTPLPSSLAPQRRQAMLAQQVPQRTPKNLQQPANQTLDPKNHGHAITHISWTGYPPQQTATFGQLLFLPALGTRAGADSADNSSEGTRAKGRSPTKSAIPSPYNSANAITIEAATIALQCPAPIGSVTLERPLQSMGNQLAASGGIPVQLRMVHLQSSAASWVSFWTQWDPARVAQDLARAAALNANAIRLFVFFNAFGGAQPTAPMLERLRTVIDGAARKGMVSVVTFFPLTQLPATRKARNAMVQHVSRMTAAFRGHPGVAMWDLFHEPHRGAPQAHTRPRATSGPATTADLRAAATAAPIEPGTGLATPRLLRRTLDDLIRAARKADPSHLVTIGLGQSALSQAIAAATSHRSTSRYVIPKGHTDVLSAHWFPHAQPNTPLEQLLDHLTEKHSTPILLQEMGISGLHATEDQAAAALSQVCATAERYRVAGLGAWELYDHPVGSIHWKRGLPQETADNYYGLFDRTGRPKKQAQAFCRCLAPPKLVIQIPERK